MTDTVAASADEVEPLSCNFLKGEKFQIVDRGETVGVHTAGFAEDERCAAGFDVAYRAVKARAEISAVRRRNKVRYGDGTRCAVKDDGGQSDGAESHVGIVEKRFTGRCFVGLGERLFRGVSNGRKRRNVSAQWLHW